MPKPFSNLKIYPETYKMLKEIATIHRRTLVVVLDLLAKKELRRLKKNEKNTSTSIPNKENS